jgi:murein DD-endopeptidase MepM/ murein hydrolase activator NlpD
VIRKAAGLLLLLAVPLGLASQEERTLRTPSGVEVRVACPSFAPGEPMLFVLKDSPGLNAAVIRFLGRTLVLRPGPSGGDTQAFLGIDLDVKPGSYALDVKVEKKDGSEEALRRDITILDRVFPTEKLWVKQEYVTPPRAVAERIRREAELVGLVFKLITPEWLGDGAFIAPHPADHWSNFGQRRLTNNTLKTVHGGVDVKVPFGDPIKAVNAGRVVLASSLYLSGNTVIIDHGLGVFSYYCHLSKLLVHRGDRVRKGDVIGKCGTTGRSTGPHLHWTMRIFDSRVDPYEMLLLPVEGGSPDRRLP